MLEAEALVGANGRNVPGLYIKRDKSDTSKKVTQQHGGAFVCVAASSIIRVRHEVPDAGNIVALTDIVNSGDAGDVVMIAADAEVEACGELVGIKEVVRPACVGF